MTSTSFATARDVTSALSALGFQPSADSIETISRTCRDTFLEHLSICVSGQDVDGVSQKVISSLLRCLSPNSISKLTAIIPNATPAAVVPLALKSPLRLLSAIEAAHDQGHERHDAAKQFLADCFAAQPPATAPLAERKAQPHVGGMQDQNTSLSRPAPAQPVSQRPAEGKKYHSCHIYGSGYALCFNAADWDGKPGVMVDAAVSDGAKSYDWKNAIHIWLDTNEVGAVLSVFRRWRKGIEFSAHGSQNDKSFAIEFQGQHFFAKVTAKKAGQHPTRAVKIMPTDATAVSILFLMQLAESYPAIPLNELLATVRASHQVSDAA